MKRLFCITLFLSACLYGLSQDQIQLLSGQKLEDVRIHKVNETKLIYKHIPVNHQQSFGGNGIAGVQWVWPNRFVMDAWYGIGVQQRDTKFFVSNYQYQPGHPEPYPNEQELQEWGSPEVRATVVAGIRLGISL